MMGGINCPPVEAMASIAPACVALYPALRISGIVMMPVVTTLEIAVPETVPNSADATTDILAAPPRLLPTVAMARSVKNCPPPALKQQLTK